MLLADVELVERSGEQSGIRELLADEELVERFGSQSGKRALMAAA